MAVGRYCSYLAAQAGWWNIPNLSQPNLVCQEMGHPVGMLRELAEKCLHSPPSGCFAGFVNKFLRVPLACLDSREAEYTVTTAELSENILQNLGNDLMADSVQNLFDDMTPFPV